MSTNCVRCVLGPREPGSLCCAACNQAAAIRPYFKRRLSPRAAALESALVPADWSRVDQGRSKNRFNELLASSEKSSSPQILPLGRLQKPANRLMETVKSNTPFSHNGECAKSKTAA